MIKKGEEDFVMIVAGYCSGLGIKYLARKFRTSQRVIYRALDKHEIDTRRCGRPNNDPDETEGCDEKPEH